MVHSVGDVLDALLALLVFKTCMQIEGGLPTGLKAKMMINIIMDFVIGIIPFVGDVADAAFRANTRNAIVLEEYLREKGKKNLKQGGKPIPATDPSDPEVFDRWEDGTPPQYRSQPPSRQPSTRSQQPMPTEPTPAEVRGGSRWGRNKARPNDVEMGEVSRDSGRSKDKRKSRR